ncbi:MAG: 1,4-alpha-glucan branching protein GlgB [Candidatus Omnitrophota bacterium]|nr:1,4-alpha-glucan branching protein GlgB [Candidatus Omnitrophota bacterium]MDZ4243458.1 1,4-alpha-glucan branching protein GlgB [Candidatus Omnitrophota bacterium]
MHPVYHDVSLFSDHDIHLFKEGTHYQLYNKLGAHEMSRGELRGTYFAVWAPNANRVSVIGNFNGWNKESHQLAARWDGSGIWEGFVPGIHRGEIYKYYVSSQFNGYAADKMDPYGFYCETPPKTASIVWDLEYQWKDNDWMRNRHWRNSLNAPIAIYEVHLGSWRRMIEEDRRSLTYREHANYLVDYVKKMGYTHVELTPIMEHPFYGSWGYQTLGYFSPTNRYGSPQDLMYLVDSFHQNGIGVILDWVPSHFPSDEHGLAYFDGTALYEHSDPQKGFHPDWKSYIFNAGRNEVKEFLISSALFWLEKYHVDGLRVDAVASMLYLDYSRKDGEWCPNVFGGREHLENISFLKCMNEVVYANYPDVQMYAEESTAWTGVSRPTFSGGLGFGMKWNMGWMHDTLEYFCKDPVYRKHHHGELTFSMLYAYTENFVLSLSHDEVVHGKGSLLSKMPCDDWQKFANHRLLLSYMYAHPGKKLLFMGGEFGQRAEWNHEHSLEWHLLQYAPHQGLQMLAKDLNAFYRREPALYEHDFDPHGFEWIDIADWQRSLLSFIRKGNNPQETILAVCNFTPTPKENYRLGVPEAGYWRELFNSDAKEYGGSGMGNKGGVGSQPVPYQNRPHSIAITIPPLAAVFFKRS